MQDTPALTPTLRDPYQPQVITCDPQTGMALVAALLSEWHGVHGWHPDGWGPICAGSPMDREREALRALICGEMDPDADDLDPSLLVD